MNKKFGLGKGIDALLEDYRMISDTSQIPLSDIIGSPFQPRKEISEGSIAELMQSIQENGLIEPLVVRKKDNKYELIAGHRRVKALHLLKKEVAPVYIISVSDQQAAQFTIIENIQRKDLNPIELAESMELLLKNFHLTHDDLAKSIGKSRVYITNLLRLLNLDPLTIESIAKEKITESHGRLLLQIENVSFREKILNEIIEKSLTVKDVEKKLKTVQKKTHNVEKKTLSEEFKKFEKTFIQIFHKPIKFKKNKVEIIFKDETDVLNFIQQIQRLYDEDYSLKNN